MTKPSDDKKEAAAARDTWRDREPATRPPTPQEVVAAALAPVIKAFDDTMPSALERAEVSLAKPEAVALLPKIAALGLWTPQQFAITELFSSFCTDWASYKVMLTKAKWAIRLVAGKQVAAALIGLIAMGDSVHEKACFIPPKVE